MMTAEEFILATNKEQEVNFKLATVAGLHENETAKLRFDGEDIESGKQYAYLNSYAPKINDRVLLCKIGGTYVVLGKVNYNINPNEEEK